MASRMSFVIIVRSAGGILAKQSCTLLLRWPKTMQRPQLQKGRLHGIACWIQELQLSKDRQHTLYAARSTNMHLNQDQSPRSEKRENTTLKH